MIVYQTDLFGRYIGPVEANESPLEPGVWLVPGGCVEVAPPTTGAHEAAFWTGTTWEIRADYVGSVRYNTATGQQETIAEYGQTPTDPGYTDIVPEPGHAWDAPNNCWCRGVTATLSALAAKKDSVIAAGFVHGGHTWQIRETDIDNFGRILLALSLGETNPHGGVYRTLDNVNVPLDDTAMRALALFAVAHHRDVLRAWAAHKDAIAAIVTAHPVAYEADEAAEDYDIEAGWPANGV